MEIKPSVVQVKFNCGTEAVFYILMLCVCFFFAIKNSLNSEKTATAPHLNLIYAQFANMQTA